MALVASFMAALGGPAPAVAQWPSGCFICWKDGGDFDDDPWYCRDADDLGYKNCSASVSSCANWEPLCERGIIADLDCYYTANGWVCFAP